MLCLRSCIDYSTYGLGLPCWLQTYIEHSLRLGCKLFIRSSNLWYAYLLLGISIHTYYHVGYMFFGIFTWATVIMYNTMLQGTHSVLQHLANFYLYDCCFVLGGLQMQLYPSRSVLLPNIWPITLDCKVTTHTDSVRLRRMERSLDPESNWIWVTSRCFWWIFSRLAVSRHPTFLDESNAYARPGKYTGQENKCALAWLI